MYCWDGGAARTASSEKADGSPVTKVNHFYNGTSMNLHPTWNYLVNDCDLIFEAQDSSGQKYIALYIGDPPGGCEYTLVPAEDKDLDEFKEERIDMRDLMLKKGEKEWYIGTMDHESGRTITNRQPMPISSSKRLPEKGYHPTAMLKEQP